MRGMTKNAIQLKISIQQHKPFLKEKPLATDDVIVLGVLTKLRGNLSERTCLFYKVITTCDYYLNL